MYKKHFLKILQIERRITARLNSADFANFMDNRIMMYTNPIKAHIENFQKDKRQDKKFNHHQAALNIEKFTGEKNSTSYSEWRESVLITLGGIQPPRAHG